MLFLQSASFTALRYFTDVFNPKFIQSSILNLNLQYSCIMSDITNHTDITDHYNTDQSSDITDHYNTTTNNNNNKNNDNNNNNNNDNNNNSNNNKNNGGDV